MNIDPLKRQPPTGIESVTHRRSTTGQGGSTLTGQESVMDNITKQNLLEHIRDLPEVRDEVTQIGRRLAEDPGYPPDELVDKLASAMADLEPGWLDALGEEGEEEA